MRIRMSSPLLLLIGLTLGLLGMWASASPLGATGDLVTGGWVACSVDGEATWFAASTAWMCDDGDCSTGKCSSQWSSTCSQWAGGVCSGGSITVISCDSLGAKTISFSGVVACNCPWNGGTFPVRNYTCY
jgi:hypothetical protein